MKVRVAVHVRIVILCFQQHFDKLMLSRIHRIDNRRTVGIVPQIGVNLRIPDEFERGSRFSAHRHSHQRRGADAVHGIYVRTGFYKQIHNHGIAGLCHAMQRCPSLPVADVRVCTMVKQLLYNVRCIVPAGIHQWRPARVVLLVDVCTAAF